MKRKNAVRNTLFTSILSLLLCVSMLVGTTFAWFTDEVTSGNNIIKSGNLDVEMYYGDSADAITNDASVGAIFSHELWEPGYTEVKYVKIANVGNLAFRFRLDIIPAVAEQSQLAEVIDVYMFDANASVDRAAIAAATPVGTLAELMADADGAAYGTLLPAEGVGSANVNVDDTPRGEITYCIVLKMQESAGNEYKNLSVGDGFKLQLMATQYTWENDSFGHDYDGNAGYAVHVSSAEEFIELLSDVRDRAKQQIPGAAGNKNYREEINIVLDADIEIDADTEFMYTDGNGAALHFYGMKGVLDLNGHDIKVSSDALLDGKTYANAVLLFQYSNVDIIGNGSIIAENQSSPIYGWANGTVNIYGGTYISNGYERSVSDIYVNNASMVINVYGGNFESSVYAFNSHDNCGNSTVIVLHEGVTFEKFLKNGTTDVIASDINAGRIAVADGCTLEETVINGETWYQVVKN